MILKLTQKGYDIFQSYLKEAISIYDKNPIGQSPSIKDNCHFVYIHNEVDEYGAVTSTEYKCCLGEEMEVDIDHYNNSQDLQEFINRGYLVIV